MDRKERQDDLDFSHMEQSFHVYPFGNGDKEAILPDRVFSRAILYSQG